MRVIKCARCGEETIAKGNSQKYCPVCAYQVRLDRQHERLIARKSRNAERAEMFTEAHEAARTSGKTRHIVCAKCGADAVVPFHAGHAKYCPTCSQASCRESHKRSKERNALTMTAICEECGKEFEYILKGKPRTTCDDCRPISNTRKKPAKLFDKPKKKAPVASIEDLATAAKAKGMSYGQYKAWLYMQEQRKKA